VPRITAATVAENRQLRREALHSAAATLIQSRGTFTMSEVAREVGLSRSAVYEYYRSASDLIADVLVDELTAWGRALAVASGPAASPQERVQAWLGAVLDYVTDGRHALLRAAASIELPSSRRAEVAELHQSLIAPLVEALEQSGSRDPVREARYVWGVVEVAIDRIENDEAAADEEADALLRFIGAALTGLNGDGRA
jgi:AcrR family transcriptional regulator